jgi:hypothetical protein
MTDNLTRSGWPRPIVDGLPVPWVSPSDDLGSMDGARSAACASGAICAVCGGDYAETEDAYVLVKAADQPRNMAAVEVHAMDNGILHRRCVLLAMARCPELRRLAVAGVLQVVKTKGNSARIAIRGGEAKAVVDGADCEVVDMASLK